MKKKCAYCGDKEKKKGYYCSDECKCADFEKRKREREAQFEETKKAVRDRMIAGRNEEEYIVF